jgi:hypothetical protein
MPALSKGSITSNASGSADATAAVAKPFPDCYPTGGEAAAPAHANAAVVESTAMVYFTRALM